MMVYKASMQQTTPVQKRNQTEKTLFQSVLGESPRIKVLDMLITGRELDYSISDISSTAGISRATFYQMMSQMLHEKVIIPTRKMGRMQLYRINARNPSIKTLIKFYDTLILNN